MFLISAFCCPSSKKKKVTKRGRVLTLFDIKIVLYFCCDVNVCFAMVAADVTASMLSEKDCASMLGCVCKIVLFCLHERHKG